MKVRERTNHTLASSIRAVKERKLGFLTRECQRLEAATINPFADYILLDISRSFYDTEPY